MPPEIFISYYIDNFVNNYYIYMTYMSSNTIMNILLNFELSWIKMGINIQKKLNMLSTIPARLSNYFLKRRSCFSFRGRYSRNWMFYQYVVPNSLPNVILLAISILSVLQWLSCIVTLSQSETIYPRLTNLSATLRVDFSIVIR